MLACSPPNETYPKRLTEKEIVSQFAEALSNGQFQVYYQPLYNHANGALVGSEALVRWLHSTHGMQSPVDFIPILENNDLISKLDLYVFEQVCILQQRLINQGFIAVPISLNASRYDLCLPDYVQLLEDIRQKYNVPAKFIRIEITESSIVCGNELINNIVTQLHQAGYMVEMDDFGSGYSSLNVLKDVDFDIIKLDMQFFSGTLSAKAGTIIRAIARMAQWLGMSVIAEGVETVEQADFMQSIGCTYIQGYLYSKPIPEKDFLELLSVKAKDDIRPRIKLIEHLDANRFWNPESLETLIFSNYVGGAAIFTYKDGIVEIIRVNKKYLAELGMNLSEQDVLKEVDLKNAPEMEGDIYLKAIEKAIDTKDEVECETWRTLHSPCCGEEKLCLRTTMRLLGTVNDHMLFYATIRNITKEKQLFQEVYASDQRFRAASEQVNIYAWEYDIQSKIMRPCFRCIRDLGLPAVLHNYPEPVIASGVIPPEYADTYRSIIKQIDEGVGNIDTIIPLTVGRVPFRIRYTTEFDKAGNPIKAYGSATLVVDNK